MLLNNILKIFDKELKEKIFIIYIIEKHKKYQQHNFSSLNKNIFILNFLINNTINVLVQTFLIFFYCLTE